MLLFAVEDSNFTMHIRVVIEKEKQIILNTFFYKVYVTFVYKKSSIIDIARVPNDALNNLLQKYRNLLNSEIFMKSLFDAKGESKSIINKVIEIFNYKKISPAFFRAIDIISIDGFSSKSIGRTIIELDADIINMLPLLTTNKLIHFRLIHNYNVLLANETFSYQSKILQKRLLWIRRTARLFSPFIPLIFQYGYIILSGSELSLSELIKDPNLLNWIPWLVGSFVGYLWYKYGPKYIIKILMDYLSGKVFK